MPLLALPNELLEAIAQHFNSAQDLRSLILSSRRLRDLLISRLYTQDQAWAWDALLWAAENGRLDVLQRAQRLSGMSISHAFGLIYESALGGHVDILEYVLGEGVMGVDWANCSGELVETPLVGAGRKGHAGAVEVLLKHEVDKDAICSDGYTALHHAVKGGFAETVKMLLQHGANPLVATPDRKTPLHTASEMGRVDLARLLIDGGGLDDTQRSSRGRTAMHFAASADAVDEDVVEVVKLLLGHGASPTERDSAGGTPLHWAASRANYQTCKLLIEHGGRASAEDESGLTPLDTAMRGGNVALVQMFLDEGGGSLQPDGGGMTPLHTAAMTGDVEIVCLLIKRGADVSARSGSGFTPLYLACSGGDVDVVTLLLDEGASADTKAGNGVTALHQACKRQAADVVGLLLAHGVEVNVQDDAGSTPLHVACEFGCLDTVELLVESGADPHLVARATGATPLHVALQKGRAETAMYLIEAVDVDVNISDAVGRTPLFYAARCGLVEVVEVLLSRNASLNALDHYGAGPLIAASRSGNLEAVELLIASDNGECLRHKDSTGHTAAWWAGRSGNGDLFNLFRAHAKKTSVKIWRSDKMPSESGGAPSLPAYEEGFCFCYICTLSVPWANWPRACTLCCGSRFAICDDCYNAGFNCLDASHRDEPETWVYLMEYCECKQHYPYTKRYIAAPELAPDVRRIFEEDSTDSLTSQP